MFAPDRESRLGRRACTLIELLIESQRSETTPFTKLQGVPPSLRMQEPL